MVRLVIRKTVQYPLVSKMYSIFIPHSLGIQTLKWSKIRKLQLNEKDESNGTKKMMATMKHHKIIWCLVFNFGRVFFTLKSLFPIYAFRHPMKLLYIVKIMDYRKCIVYNLVSSSSFLCMYLHIAVLFWSSISAHFCLPTFFLSSVRCAMRFTQQKFSLHLN